MAGVLRRVDEDTDAHRGIASWGHREETAVYSPGERPQVALLTPGSLRPASRTGDCKRLLFELPRLWDFAIGARRLT